MNKIPYYIKEKMRSKKEDLLAFYVLLFLIIGGFLFWFLIIAALCLWMNR